MEPVGAVRARSGSAGIGRGAAERRACHHARAAESLEAVQVPSDDPSQAGEGNDSPHQEGDIGAQASRAVTLLS